MTPYIYIHGEITLKVIDQLGYLRRHERRGYYIKPQHRRPWYDSQWWSGRDFLRARHNRAAVPVCDYYNPYMNLSASTYAHMSATEM